MLLAGCGWEEKRLSVDTVSGHETNRPDGQVVVAVPESQPSLWQLEFYLWIYCCSSRSIVDMVVVTDCASAGLQRLNRMCFHTIQAVVS